MNWNAKLQISAIVLIICHMLVAAFSFYQRTNIDRELSFETKVEITKVDPKVSRESDGQTVWDKIQNYSVTYRYELNGKKLEKTGDMPRNSYKNFKVGDVAKICYNSQNPNKTKLVLETELCGK